MRDLRISLFLFGQNDFKIANVFAFPQIVIVSVVMIETTPRFVDQFLNIGRGDPLFGPKHIKDSICRHDHQPRVRFPVSKATRH